jgi:hypothetical protein
MCSNIARATYSLLMLTLQLQERQTMRVRLPELFHCKAKQLFNDLNLDT